MAKKSMIVKQKREPKFKVQAYTRCERCGRPHSVYRKFKLCRICFRELAYKGEIPGVRNPAGKPSPLPFFGARDTYPRSFRIFVNSLIPLHHNLTNRWYAKISGDGKRGHHRYTA